MEASYSFLHCVEIPALCALLGQYLIFVEKRSTQTVRADPDGKDPRPRCSRIAPGLAWLVSNILCSSTVATLERAQGTHTCQGPTVRIPFSRITQGSSTQHAATTVHLPYLHTAATAYTYTYMHICPHQKCRDAEAKQWRWWGFSVLLNRLRRRMGEAFLPLNVAMLLP